MPQTNYSLCMERGFEGQIITAVSHTIRKKVNGHTDVFPFGLACVLDSTDPGIIRLPSATGQLFGGVLTLEYIYETVKNATYNLPGIPVKGDGGAMEIGEVLVYAEQAVAPTDPVYFRHTAGTTPNTIPGRFRKDADTNKADVITGARWKEKTSAAGLTTLILNRP